MKMLRRLLAALSVDAQYTHERCKFVATRYYRSTMRRYLRSKTERRIPFHLPNEQERYIYAIQHLHRNLRSQTKDELRAGEAEN